MTYRHSSIRERAILWWWRTTWNGCHDICSTCGIRTVEHWHLRTIYIAFFARRSELRIVAGFIAFRNV